MDSIKTDNDHCLNCGTALKGRWCHHCGQPVKGMVRHFTSIIGDVLDTLFEYDNRIWRTVLLLYVLPGRVTADFIAGRRMRYVLPFRLFFVLSVITFLVLQFIAVPQRMANIGMNGDRSTFEQFATVEEVEAERDRTLADMQRALEEVEADSTSTFAAPGIRAGMELVDEAARRRILELDPTAQLPDTEPARPGVRFAVDGQEVWNPLTDPVELDWLPAGMNQRLNQWIERGINNIERAGEDPSRLVEAMFGLLPVVLFVLMPLFALMLKLFHLLTGRLYMEHLVVALYSHSFLFLALLVVVALNGLRGLLAGVPYIPVYLQILYWLALLWIPLYLLLMQKRVYQQGWMLTTLKYFSLGVVYLIMVLFALTLAAVISLINL